MRLVVFASAAKQSILSYCGKMDCFAALAMTAGAMDCFAEPVIGRIARRGCERAFSRLCERSEAIHSFFARRDGLLRCARNDGAARWIASRSLSSGAHSRDPVARNDGPGEGLLRGAGHRARRRRDPVAEYDGLREAELVRRRSTSDAEPTRQSSNRHSFRRPFNPSVDARVQMIAFGCRIVH